MREKQRFENNFPLPAYSFEINQPIEIDADSSNSSDIIEISYEASSSLISSTSKTINSASEEFANAAKKQKLLSPPDFIEVEENNIRMEIEEKLEDPLNLHTLSSFENTSNDSNQNTKSDLIAEEIEQENIATVSPLNQKDISNWISKINCKIFKFDKRNAGDSVSDSFKDVETRKEINVYSEANVLAPIISSENHPTPRILKSKLTAPLKVAEKSGKGDVEKETQVDENFLMLLRAKYKCMETFTNLIIFRKPYLYTGLYGSTIGNFVDGLMTLCNASSRDIFLTLMKIRQDDSFGILQDIFDTPAGSAEEIFQTTAKKMANFLKVSLLSYKDVAPAQLNSCKKKIHSIIDYFEVKVHNSEDWCHNNCKKVKFLISVTSEGFINFVSSGFCEDIKDLDVLISSDYLDKLHEGTAVIANRHFYGIGETLRKKHCMFIQSDSGHEKFPGISAEDVSTYRENVNLIFKNLREFEFIGVKACVPKDQLEFLHKILIIASAIVNTYVQKTSNQTAESDE